MVSKAPLEAEEGKLLVAYLRLRGITFTHIPGETGQSPEARRRAIRVKQQGYAKGTPDYMIALPGIGCLWIELKRQRGSVVSPEQKAWIETLNKCPGTQAFVAKGADAAIAIIEQFYPQNGTATHF